MFQIVSLNSSNFDWVHRIFPGNTGKYWVNFNWYWAQLSERNIQISSALICMKMEGEQVPLGFIAYGQHYSDRQLRNPVGGVYEFYHMVIDSSYQRRGVGRMATIYILNEMAKIQDCQKLVVACHPDNVSATKLYKSLGFKEFSTNYDNDPLYVLDSSDIIRLEYLNTPKRNDVSDGEGRSLWEKESRQSMTEFDWAAWELGLEE